MTIPLTFWIDRLASPIGTIVLAWDDAERLRALDFADFEPRMQRLMVRQYDHPVFTSVGHAPDALTTPLLAYFGGELDALASIAVATGGTEFQRRVWAALRTIAAGTTTTYGRLAQQIGQAAATRAVGLANGSNPIAIVVPCHRVIGADGSLTGYGGGMERKRWLLQHEQQRTVDLPLFRRESSAARS